MHIQGAVSQYTVHWILTVENGRAETYSRVIRKAWLLYRGVAGERRLVCDYAANVVIVVLGVTADGICEAIDESRPLVVGPLERRALPLPGSTVVIAARITHAADGANTRRQTGRLA